MSGSDRARLPIYKMILAGDGTFTIYRDACPLILGMTRAQAERYVARAGEQGRTVDVAGMVPEVRKASSGT